MLKVGFAAKIAHIVRNPRHQRLRYHVILWLTSRRFSKVPELRRPTRPRRIALRSPVGLLRRHSWTGLLTSFARSSKRFPFACVCRLACLIDNKQSVLKKPGWTESITTLTRAGRFIQRSVRHTRMMKGLLLCVLHEVSGSNSAVAALLAWEKPQKMWRTLP